MAIQDLDLSRYKLGWSDAEDYVFKPKKGLSEDIVREMSEMKGEPEWMRTFRLNALKRFDRKPIRKIVCAVDRDSRARSVLAWVRDFAGTLGAAVTVVHAITALPDLSRNSWSLQLRRDGEAAVKRRLHELAIRADLHVETGEVTPVVMAALRNTDADLLVIGRSTRSDPFGPIVTNSYSLIRHSNCPVISV